ncbi:sulfite exporter TauE/SafE family protein [Aquamicrobium zhengzhouense]|uniref:Probable membrane transporter protein n=1 Tax=Aquamicrobium zhengzhouense TaxID=2781738 RepID=A0ABS0SG27_9HYPH|nr:sulfite exporter TauE/SafE family protein [Aquamicrobium zhengzhouense]MBI1621626.1 sulfite exporter TauE/SafE family protein [Aquamicrobium zhengzhouense]
MLTYIVLLLAGFCAGALNAVAGGGTFLSFPALVWVGVPPIAANATATFAALPGYVGSAWGFRKDMRSEGPLSVKIIIALAVLGGFLGALLLLVTSPDVFRVIVPWLLLLATAVFAAGPALLKMITARGAGGLGAGVAAILLLAIATYGGYFNGGLGIMLLAGFGLIGFTDLNAMNGLKNVISAILSLVSVATYMVAGLIDWTYALPVAIACTVGGYVGAALARRITRPQMLRIFITLVGAVMTVAFFLV